MTRFLDNAREAWGDAVTDEVIALAEEADRTTGRAAADRIGYSAAVVTQVLRRTYPGDMPTVFARIRGALLAETVGCPVLGEIGRDHCLDEQSRPFAATNSSRALLAKTCPTCPNRRGATP
jgi:hypothetical protein